VAFLGQYDDTKVKQSDRRGFGESVYQRGRELGRAAQKRPSLPPEESRARRKRQRPTNFILA